MSEVARHYNFHLMMTAKLLNMRCYGNLYRKIRSQTHHTINLWSYLLYLSLVFLCLIWDICYSPPKIYTLIYSIYRVFKKLSSEFEKSYIFIYESDVINNVLLERGVLEFNHHNVMIWWTGQTNKYYSITEILQNLNDFVQSLGIK